jgi:hypothetical protein
MEVDKLTDLIIKNMQENKDDLGKRIDVLTVKVDELLEFKWKILGMATVTSAVIAFLFHLFELSNK